jgi:hypothetical protein
MKTGDHVRVTTKPIPIAELGQPLPERASEGNTVETTAPHPHAGKTGIITELLGVRLTGPGWPPRAMIRIDVGYKDAGNIMIVSLKYLEPA